MRKTVRGEKMADILITFIGIAAVILIWIILYDSNRFIVVRHTFSDARIRQPFRAVVLADLHNKRYGRDNEVLLEAIRKQEPDAVIIAGDMMIARKGKSFSPAIALLRSLAEKYPVYYADGNHEHRLKLYPEEYGSMAEAYENALREIGIERLINRHTVLEKYGIAIYGSEIDREYYKRFSTYPMPSDYLDRLLGRPAPEKFNILLAHNPDYFLQYASWGADIVLAGHVHGGVVRIPGGKGLISPAVRFFPKYDGGLFRQGDSVMLVSRGLGTHSIPFRLFNPGELIVLELSGSEKRNDNA